MNLLKLTLINFKGIQSFELDTKGGNVNIYGDNATGKTTVADAFSWLLFDKDSQNKKDFEIKTLDAAGQAIHNLNHEVEAEIDHDGRIIVLKKVFMEKWTKKRGNPSPEFTGHTTEYFIDGVPCAKKMFDKCIAEIIDESIFKLLTNPLYFNEQLHWQDRRKLLLEICGDISDDEVIASDKALAKLPEILNGRKLEDHRKVIAARRSKINEELQKIPVRIDEATRNLPDIGGIFNREVIETEIASLKRQQQAKQQEIVRIENGGESAEKQKALSQVDSRIIEIKNAFRNQNSDRLYDLRIKQQDVRMQLNTTHSDIGAKARVVEANNAEINRCQTAMQTLKDKWYQVSDRQFTFEQDAVCPTCGQALPQSRLDETRQKALDQFNLTKSKELESINDEGKRHKRRVAELLADNERLQAEIAKLEEGKVKLEQRIAGLQKQIDALGEVPDITTDPEYQKAISDKDAILAQLNNVNTQKQGVIRQLNNEINLIANDIASRERSLVLLDQHKQGQERIKELQLQEKELAAEFEKLEGELYLTEQFVRTKVSMLEGRINSKFKYARFKLFDTQINGGLSECCETTYGGVPYSSGLNNAARINVGLDIINTLSEHYNFTAPIFVDNREAVTVLTETKAQVISLIVSEPDKSLRVVI